MIDDLFFDSRFWLWCSQQQSADADRHERLRAEALSMLLEGINTGEITTLDGTDSPLSQRIKAQHQASSFEMNSNWAGTSQNWKCPCCGRSKFQVSRTGQTGQILAKLVVHHDHMDDALKAAFHAAFAEAGTDIAQADGLRLVERIGNAFSAYEPVLLCEDCNNAETAAKRCAGAPADFSFSPGQIRAFIRPGDHRPHDVDPVAATNVWRSALPAYELRMQLVRTVAHAAATDSHWYEPVASGTKPIPAFGHTFRPGDPLIAQWIGSEALVQALAPRRVGTPDYSRWRTSSHKRGKAPPANYIAMLRSEQGVARAWDDLQDEWACPICSRGKKDTVYVGNKGKVCFMTWSNPGRGAWKSATLICQDCHSVVIAFKREVVQGIGQAVQDSYALITPAELRSVIAAHPHCPHAIQADIAKTLVERTTLARRGLP